MCSDVFRNDTHVDTGRDTQLETDMCCHKPPFIFQNKENILRRGNGVSTPSLCFYVKNHAIENVEYSHNENNIRHKPL
jgi:hypothetical protein